MEEVENCPANSNPFSICELTLNYRPALDFCAEKFKQKNGLLKLNFEIGAIRLTWN